MRSKILTCPSCETRYELPEERLGEAGAKVRCHLCGHLWRARQEELAEAPEKTVSDSPGKSPAKGGESAREMRERFKAGPSESGTRRASRLILALLAALAALAAAFWFAREELATRFPALAPLYQTLGVELSQPGDGLVISGVRSISRFEDSARVLIVEGQVANQAETSVSLPDLQFRLLSASGRELRRWVERLPQASLAPGQRVVFSSRLENAPTEDSSIEVGFAGNR